MNEGIYFYIVTHTVCTLYTSIESSYKESDKRQ